MRSLNSCTLIGRLGADPEVKTVGEAALCRFSLATSKSFKQNDEWKEVTQWHKVTAWRYQADQAAKFQKGDLVLVAGSIEYREHEGKYFTDIVAERVQLFDRPKSEKQETGDWKAEPTSGGWTPPASNNNTAVDDDLPF